MRIAQPLTIVAALFGMAAHVQVSAQTRPALVQDVDQADRHAYWEDADLRSNAGSCIGNSCSLTFATVPSGTRRVIEYVACTFSASSSSDVITFVELNTQSPYGKSRARLPAAQSVPGMSPFFTNQRLLAYYASGEQVAVIAYDSGNASPRNMHCSLSGHDVTLP
ncbi:MULTISPECIES: hypothetical protein [Roseateles]|uniref:Secreted protein n=1 Tax=Pelomonas caseinilytica TaxID=2906763 RepID=A0ABS8XI90_9BURK|nr:MULTISPECIES: hypothetical protein [unclassified Roseateles]MCE4538251.1 hypothetical protein [Pelomonas sp. P7]HEV6966524.1 hypothetical protein [Roseateles sp.]